MPSPQHDPLPRDLKISTAIKDVIIVVAASLLGLTLVGAGAGLLLSPLGMLIGVSVSLIILRHEPEVMREYGFRMPSSFREGARTTIFALVGAFVIFNLADRLIAPEFGEANTAVFEPIIGNPGLLVVTLFASWVGAAVGEEAVYRGFVQTHLARAIGGERGRWIGNIAQALIFSSLHFYQGWAGVIHLFLFALFLGWVYWRSERSLLPLILAHGLMNSLSFIGLYMQGSP
jgi:membrane protease YdiL (CAAX protease family)